MSKNVKNMDMTALSWVQNADFLPMTDLSCIQFRRFYIFQKCYLESEKNF